jgi:hypothetical protein
VFLAIPDRTLSSPASLANSHASMPYLIIHNNLPNRKGASYAFVLTSSAIICVLCLLCSPYKAKANMMTRQQPPPAQVYLGGATFIPPSLILTGTSTYTVSVATTATVPAGVTAVLSLSENNNFNGITYSVAPAQIANVVLTGGGRSDNGQVTFTIDSQNTKSGNISYRATLVRLTNVPQGVTVTPVSPGTTDATLQVATPTPTPTPTPSPTPIPTPTPIPCSNPVYYARDPISGACVCRNGNSAADCDADQLWHPNICQCQAKGGSPILIDIDGSSFQLTDAANGVDFDLNADGLKERIGWTAVGSTNGFLFLDRNENGVVDNGIELFGNVTPQRQSRTPNGFVALAEFDRVQNGGNGDGIIDHRDAIFLQLRLWQDANHDGICQSWEVHTLRDFGIESISLDYKISRRTDQYGNSFRYRAKVDDSKHSHVAKWAWDVFLVGAQ